jgi:hypothetical protein
MVSIAKVGDENLCQDLLESFFPRWLEKHYVIDMAPKKISHTWRNRRKGVGLVEI